MVKTFVQEHMPALVIAAEFVPFPMEEVDPVALGLVATAPVVEYKYKDVLKRVVHHVQRLRWEELYEELCASNRQSHVAWLRSCSTPGSARCFTWRGGGSQRFTFTREQFQDTLRNRLLLPIIDTGNPHANFTCQCGQLVSFTSQPTHAIDCTRNAPLLTRRHDEVARLLGEFVKRCCPMATIEVEPSVFSITGPRVSLKADLRIRMNAILKVIDVAVVDPGCSTALAKGSANFPDRAARMRQEQKINQYAQVVPHIVNSDVFVAFVVEATGRLGPSAKAFVDKIGENHSFFRSRFLDQLSGCIARYNALMFSKFRSGLIGDGGAG
jgi:hypothetical protein